MMIKLIQQKSLKEPNLNVGMEILENSVDILEVKNDTSEELVNAVNAMIINDENTVEVTFEYKIVITF